MAKTAAFFDIDNTLVKGSSSVILMRGLIGEKLLSKREVAYQLYHGLRFMLKGESMEFLDKMQAEGLPIRKPVGVEWVAEQFSRVYDSNIVPRLKEKTLKKFYEHQASGHDIWLISAAPQSVVDTFVEKLGATGGVGTPEDIKDGHYTGKLSGDLMHASGKAEMVHELADKNGYDLSQSYAYSDSVNDIPLLKAVGHPTVVSPDKELAQYAKNIGWNRI